ncbi:MAG: hypothetical protein MK102_04950 [Fuerstiella sp.]|nr:hypothetical protein [Fuerstiella sp.]
MTQKSTSSVDRRDLLKTTVGVASAIALSTTSTVHAVDEEPSSFIEAYPGKLSYQPGEEVDLHVSTTADRYSIEIARIGARRKTVWTKDNITGSRYDTPENASTHGCGWPVSLRIRLPNEWKSGYYSITLKTENADGQLILGEAFFVLRSAAPGRNTQILLQLTTNTYNAYNNWGGPCLYESGPRPLQGDRVSFQRPMARGFLTKPDAPHSRWAPYAGWHNWEREFTEWAEREGYQLDYAVNADLEQQPELLKNYRLVLSVGHDEYWSAPMRDQLEAFIARGGNVAFFSGNVCYWQVRMEDDGNAMVGYKFNYEQDPYFEAKQYRHLSTLWSNQLVDRPENELTGVSFNYGGYHRFGSVPLGAGGYTIHRPEHWIFEGTELRWGDLLGAQHKIVGYECDGCEFVLENGLPVPTHRDRTPEGFEILASAPARLWDGDLEFASKSLFGDAEQTHRVMRGSATMGIYTLGGTVFTTGCTEWSRGLAGNDPLVQQITRNVLDRLSSS